MNDSNFQEINHSDVNKILFPKQISINNLRDVERKLLNPLVTKDIIITGKRALINCKKLRIRTIIYHLISVGYIWFKFR